MDGSPDSTSNPTIRYYFKSPDFKEDRESFDKWLLSIIDNTAICISDKVNVAYQNLDEGYRARSFEDSFISRNIEIIKKKLR